MSCSRPTAWGCATAALRAASPTRPLTSLLTPHQAEVHAATATAEAAAVAAPVLGGGDRGAML